MMKAQDDTNHLPQMQLFRFQRLPAEEQLRRASSFFQTMSTRRTNKVVLTRARPVRVN
jgi:hypothetical protein